MLHLENSTFYVSFLPLFDSSRVRFHVNALDLFKCGVRVHPRCTERGVTKQFLYRANICAVIQHRGRKSVPEDVRRVLFERGNLAHSAANNAIEGAFRQRNKLSFAIFLNEERRRIGTTA